MLGLGVIWWYSWIDETLDDAISNYFFYNNRRSNRGDWYSKKYKNFKLCSRKNISFTKARFCSSNSPVLEEI